MRDGGHSLFYSNNINSNNTIILDDRESGHAGAVLRIKPGQSIQITDGTGAVYNCQCEKNNKHSVSCGIIDKKQIQKITPEVTLLIGLPDKERFEAILEHATALGVSRIIPLAADHCRNPWWGAWDGLRQRFMSKMTVSMKQCLYPYLPQLGAPMPLVDAIDKCDGILFVADQHGNSLRDADILPHKKISCLVGPPGGLSAEESAFLESYATIPVITVTIAPARLRTELAATALCSRVIGAHTIKPA
jgi:16S rRNA (uracil1498-N3)-methyltransferase